MPRSIHGKLLFNSRDTQPVTTKIGGYIDMRGHWNPPIPSDLQWLRGIDFRVRGLGAGKGVMFMGKVYQYPVFYEQAKWAKFLYEVVGLPRSIHLGVKEHNQLAAYLLRTRPSSLVKAFNKTMLETWVDPVRPLAEKYCSLIGWKRGWDTQLLTNLWVKQEKVYQAISDNQENLIPFILRGHDLDKIKSSLSKKGWKKLCNNSVSRNQRLALLETRLIGEYLDVPTTLLRQILTKRTSSGHFNIDSINWYLSNYKGRTTLAQKSERVRMMNTYTDTRHMASQLGENFNPKWSYRRMSEKHEEFTQAIRRKAYSDEAFPWTALLPEEVKKVEHRGYTATLLDNALAIREEGDSMRHCVGSYATRSSQAKYMVYSITKDDKRVSTLGINMENYVSKEDPDSVLRGGYRFNQHYGYGNSHITDEDVKTLESKVLMKLKSMSEGFEDE